MNIVYNIKTIKLIRDKLISKTQNNKVTLQPIRDKSWWRDFIKHVLNVKENLDGEYENIKHPKNGLKLSQEDLKKIIESNSITNLNLNNKKHIKELKEIILDILEDVLKIEI